MPGLAAGASRVSRTAWRTGNARSLTHRSDVGAEGRGHLESRRDNQRISLLAEQRVHVGRCCRVESHSDSVRVVSILGGGQLLHLDLLRARAPGQRQEQRAAPAPHRRAAPPPRRRPWRRSGGLRAETLVLPRGTPASRLRALDRRSRIIMRSLETLELLCYLAFFASELGGGIVNCELVKLH